MEQVVQEIAQNSFGSFSGAADFADKEMKLRLSVELVRHGEKTPPKVYDFTKNPEKNFKKSKSKYRLTEIGYKSSYING